MRNQFNKNTKKYPAVATGSKAEYHAIRHNPGMHSKENERERSHELRIVDGIKRPELIKSFSDLIEGVNRHKADQVRADNEGRIVDDFIKTQDMNRKEKNKFLRLFELGIYYVDKGKVRIDNKKYKELLHLYHSNTEFDKKVERKAMKAYDRYAKKAFGSEFGHNTPAEKRVAADPNLRNIHDYSKMEYMKNKIHDKYKRRYAKARQRYIKKEFKKRYSFNKWKNKYGYTL